MLDDSWIEKLYASSGQKEARSVSDDTAVQEDKALVYGDELNDRNKRSGNKRIEF